MMSAPGTSSGSAIREPLDLRLVVVGGVVVPDADRDVAERAGGHELECVAHEELRRREPEAREVRSTFSSEASRKPKLSTPTNRLSSFPSIAAIRLAPWKTPISTYASSRSRHARGEVEKREVVLAREVLDVVGDRLEAPVAGMLGVREVLEEPRKLVEEAIGGHGGARRARPRGGS